MPWLPQQLGDNWKPQQFGHWRTHGYECLGPTATHIFFLILDGTDTITALAAKIGMSPKLALRLEGRWRITDTNITTSSGVYCDYWGYCYGYASDWYSSGELSAGLTYKLGGR